MGRRKRRFGCKRLILVLRCVPEGGRVLVKVKGCAESGRATMEGVRGAKGFQQGSREDPRQGRGRSTMEWSEPG